MPLGWKTLTDFTDQNACWNFSGCQSTRSLQIVCGSESTSGASQLGRTGSKPRWRAERSPQGRAQSSPPRWYSHACIAAAGLAGVKPEPGYQSGWLTRPSLRIQSMFFLQVALGGPQCERASAS